MIDELAALLGFHQKVPRLEPAQIGARRLVNNSVSVLMNSQFEEAVCVGAYVS